MRPGLYLHLPFCSAICPYCDFYVLTGNRQSRARFTDRLIAEIALARARPWPSFVAEPPALPFDTLYLGGGTPSLMDLDSLGHLLERVCSWLPVASDPWIALEANPEDVTAARLKTWAELGVAFLSLGVQSFDGSSLEFLGRRHRPGDSRACVRSARASGIETISIDLMYGLPGQTTDQWRAELETAIELRPDHLSCYQLTFERGTPFDFRKQRGELAPLDVDRQAELFFLTHRLLLEHGFEAYEVSNFATAGEHRSRHNSKYWNHTPYLGLGPSAHSHADRRRWWNERKIKPYSRAVQAGRRPILGRETLDPARLCLERLMLGLRTPSGIDFESLPADMGPQVWQANVALIERLQDRGLARVADRTLRPTLSGLAVAEALARDFEIPPP